MTRAGIWGAFLLLVFLIFIRVAPAIETRFFPCAGGISINRRIADDGRIHIQQARFWKSDVCVYRQMLARAGSQDLAIEFTTKIGNRPGGEFVARDIFLEQPYEPAAVEIRLSARHRWNPLWSSTSELFTLAYGGR